MQETMYFLFLNWIMLLSLNVLGFVTTTFLIMFFPFVSHDPLIYRGPESVVTGLDSLHKDEQRVGESDTRLDSLSTGICRILTLGNNQNGFSNPKLFTIRVFLEP